MNELEARCLNTFPEWLRTLGADAAALSEIVTSDAPESARRHVAGGLNYLFKSLDLIPDGIEDLGYLDDAIILRVAASLALAESPALSEGAAGRLAGEASLVASILDADYDRLVRYVKGLGMSAARGRTVDEILGSAESSASFVAEVRGWATSYSTPGFAHDEKNLVKLKSFLHARLPA